MPRTIVIVEDDEDTLSIYRTALTEHGYRVFTAVHGAEGVHLARRHRPDLILLDIRMPVMDGWQAIRYLRSYPQTRAIPVCAISAYEPEPEELERAGQWTFDCHWTKPIEPADLVARIEERIGPPSGPWYPYPLPATE